MERKRHLLNKLNVTGFCERPEGVDVFVTKKLKKETIERNIKNKKSPWKKRDMVPKAVKTGINREKPTKVIEIGEIKIHFDRKRYRPIEGGCEISLKGSRSVGTAGAPVTYKRYGSLKIMGVFSSFLKLLERVGLKPVIVNALLTNTHVVAKNVSRPIIGLPIVQPGVNGEEIGLVSTTTPILNGYKNRLDAALVDTGIPNSGKILKVGEVKGHRQSIRGESVHKYGRTTSYTSGKCLSKNATLYVNYGEFNALMVNCDIYSRMSNSGDSGSVIIAKKDNYAVSLLFAGSDKVTIGIPMPSVVDELGISFINKKEV